MVQSNFLPLLLLVAATTPALAQNATIGCFTDGECLDGTTVGISVVPSVNDCLAFCDTLEICSFFTYDISGELCIALQDCPEVSNANCQQCYSGDASCPDLLCEEPGTISNILNLPASFSRD